jgi:hypothetical protein
VQRHPLILHLASSAAALAALLPGVALGTAAQRPAAGIEALELSEVRAVFGRVDADADGRLGQREADHGGVDAREFARFDADADGGLDRDEFVVARHALSGAGGLRPAPDLAAEATRIRAAWRARRALESARGPSAARLRSRTHVDADDPRPSSASPSTGEHLGRPATPRLAPRVPSYPLEVAGGLPPALGLTRLGGDPALVSAVSLEERARAAQELIEARLKARGGPWRGRVVVRATTDLRPARRGAGPGAAQRPAERSGVVGAQTPRAGPAAGRARSTARSGGGPR